MSRTRATCRCCCELRPCLEWTLRVRNVVIDDNSDILADVLTGLCEDCLYSHGPDAECSVPEEQDEAEARAERAYRELNRGEL